MNYFLLSISAFLNGTKSVCAKKGNQYINETQNIYAYNFYMFFVALIVALAVGIPTFNGLSLLTLIVGICYGVSLYFAQFFLIRAISEGNTSVSTLVYSCGFLGPTLFSVLRYGEDISVFQILGIALIVVSFVVTLDKGGITSKKWFLYIFMAVLCNALCGICQKIFAMSEFKAEQSGFMIIVFLSGTVAAFIFAPKKLKLPTRPFLLTSFSSGAVLGALNMLNVYLSKKLPGSIVFPCVNSGGIIFSAILAWILLREKLSTRKIIGLVLGIIAIFAIAML
jgi:drug/metabolite transporter (DMT)-like permease